MPAPCPPYADSTGVGVGPLNFGATDTRCMKAELPEAIKALERRPGSANAEFAGALTPAWPPRAGALIPATSSTSLVLVFPLFLIYQSASSSRCRS